MSNNTMKILLESINKIEVDEYDADVSNRPNEKTLDMKTQMDSGDDLNRPKNAQFRSRDGDNPMAMTPVKVKNVQESLEEKWKQFVAESEDLSSKMKEPQPAYWHALNVIKGRWPEAEPYIMKNPKSAYLYAANIIKGRWPEAEKYIKRHAGWWDLYKTHVLKQPDVNESEEVFDYEEGDNLPVISDTVQIDMVTFIRLLELVREDIHDDITLHNVAEEVGKLSAGDHVITMDDYPQIEAVVKNSPCSKDMSDYDELSESIGSGMVDLVSARLNRTSAMVNRMIDDLGEDAASNPTYSETLAELEDLANAISMALNKVEELKSMEGLGQHLSSDDMNIIDNQEDEIPLDAFVDTGDNLDDYELPRI